MKTSSSLLVVLAALLLNAATISQSSHFPLIPGKSSNHELPIDPLENTQPESIDDCDEELQRPSKRDLNERRLRRRLGMNFDERFLSRTEPLQSSEKMVRRISLRSITTTEKNFLRQVIRNETVPRMGKPSVFMERYMMKWLIQKSDCPVEHNWKDLGFCYWPRWLLMGRCVEKQCSWPQGMSCAPSDPVPVYLLRWHCKSRSGKKAKRGTDSSRVSCRWLKFRYPIIHECKCKCVEKRETDNSVTGPLLPQYLLQEN